MPTAVADDRRRVVVVGNHTLLADALRDRLKAVASATPTQVHVVIPVHREDEVDVGHWRGRAVAERLQEAGARVTVDVGVGDPVSLAERSVRGAHVDLVLLSTLPVGLSRWLEADVAGRLRHVLDAPVEVVTAEG